MGKLTEAEKAARKLRRRAKRKRTLKSIKKMVKHAVALAELLFPDTGSGSLRHRWVTEAVKHVETPAGDTIEAAALNFLIELAVSRL